MIGKRGAKGVEVTAVASKPVHAHYRARIPRIAPFSVDDAMKAVRAETAEVMFAWFGHAGVVGIVLYAAPPNRRGKRAARQCTCWNHFSSERASVGYEPHRRTEVASLMHAFVGSRRRLA